MRNLLYNEFKSHLPVQFSEVNLDKILATGQVFRWRKFEETWFGVIRNRLWILRQDASGIHYTFHNLKDDNSDANESLMPAEELSDYLNLSHRLSEMTKLWTRSDPHLSSLLTSHPGLRLIRQDPYECLLAFITSSCNNIPRISSLMLKLSQLSKHSRSVCGTDFHPLPDIGVLLRPGTEQRLRELGFGYRAKYIVSAMKGVEERGGVEWLESLRNVELADARKELSQLAGVGPKVASCVCLMSLDKHDAVPIDTHIYQVAVKHYGRPNKALTPALHHSIELFFQKKHGKYAGWAQGYLFYSNSNKESKPATNKNKPEKQSGSTEKKRKTNGLDNTAILDLPRTRTRSRVTKSKS